MPEADIVVARAPNRAIAEMWAELLGSNGIVCRIVPLNLGGSIYVPREDDMELRVPAIDAARALDLLPREPETILPLESDDDDDFEIPTDPVETRLRWGLVGAV